jgi:hypothetical protein
MSIFSVLNERDTITIESKILSQSKFFDLKQKVNYYMSLDENNNIISNTSNSFRNMYYGGKTILINSKNSKTQNIITNMNTVSHNFTLINNLKSKEIWGVGGCGRKKTKNKFTDGIYLLFSKNNMQSWKSYGNIIVAKATKGWNPKGDSNFDSNITAFYSNILKKYVIITRYNIGAGSRGLQVFTSKHFKRGWDNGRLCKINTYNIKENYYMNKVIEITKYGIFIMVAPFSDLKRRSKSGLKFLISSDLINWIDCGLLKESDAVAKHSSTPDIQSVGIRFNEKTDILSIYYHDNYFSGTPSTIFIMECDINSLLSVSFTKKTLIVEPIITSRTMKIGTSNFITSKPSSITIEINETKLIMDDKNTIKLPNSIELNKKTKIKMTVVNCKISGFNFI